MKRIVIIQNTIPHYRQPVYNELAKFYDVTVLHSGSRSVGPGDRYKEMLKASWHIGSLSLQGGVLGAIQGGAYDVAIVMFDIHWIANVIASLVPRKCRLIYWGHRYSEMHRWTNGIRDWLARHADAQLLYGDEEVPAMISRGLDASRIYVAGNTIHVPNHANGSMADKNSFIFVGRAQRRKRVEDLLCSFARARDRIPGGYVINIVGEGEANDRLRWLAGQLGISESVRFHGHIVEPEALRSLYHSAAAMVSPGHVGLAVLHAFAYGVPVVTRRSARHAQEFHNLVDGVNSILYDSAEQLETALVLLCNDRRTSEQLGTNAYRLYTERRTLGHMVKGFCDAIEGRATTGCGQDC